MRVVSEEVEDTRHRPGSTMCLQELTDGAQHVMMLSRSQGANVSFVDRRTAGHVDNKTKQQPTGD
jgi:hypothetical protein